MSREHALKAQGQFSLTLQSPSILLDGTTCKTCLAIAATKSLMSNNIISEIDPCMGCLNSAQKLN